jgi:glycosyltransferase involved in cell wall biosynthesis
MRVAAIDVLLPVRNGVRFLGESIDSIRNQTLRDWRLLVLDHGSNDGSVELAHEYADRDKRIEVFSFPKADGLAGLLNAGLERCDCRHVMRQDADDISMAIRMETINDAFRNNAGLLVVGGEAIVIDSLGNRMGYLRMPSRPAAVAAASFFCTSILHPAVTLSYSALRRIGGAYGKDLLNAVPASQSMSVTGLAEDYFLFGQLAILGPCANVDVPIVEYRRHGESVGSSKHSEQIDLALRISRFLAKSFCIMKGLEEFDPGPFCNHADYVFDFQLTDYSAQFTKMASALRRGLGQ